MCQGTFCGIYSIENIINHKKYIGQSVDIKHRWYCHRSDLKNKKHDNDYLQKSWDKYGEENFQFKILEQCPRDMLNEKERYYIDLYNTMNRDCGYNLKSGGQDCNYVTDDVKRKISAGNKRYYAEHPEARVQRSNAAYEQWQNPDIKAKILGENNGMYGKTHSQEAREKISKAQKGRVSKHRNTTPVFCVELNRLFVDAVTACDEIGLNKTRAGNIHEACKGIRNRKTVGGYHWKYIENNT